MLYRPEYAHYQWLLTEMLIAGTFGYIAVILGFAVTSTRRFDVQLPLQLAVAITSGLASLIAIPRFGLSGAALALGGGLRADRRPADHIAEGSVIERLAFLLLCLLAFTIPWEKSMVVSGIGTVAKAVGSLALAAGVIAAAVRRNVRTPNLAMAIAACFIFWSGSDPLLECRFGRYAREIANVLAAVYSSRLVWDLCRTMERSQTVLACYVAGACVASCATLLRFAQHVQTYYVRYAAPGF